MKSINRDENRVSVRGINIVLSETDFVNIGLSNKGMTDLILPPEDSVRLWEKTSISSKKKDLDFSAKEKFLKEDYQRLMDIVSKVIEGKIRAFDTMTMLKDKIFKIKANLHGLSSKRLRRRSQRLKQTLVHSSKNQLLASDESYTCIQEDPDEEHEVVLEIPVHVHGQYLEDNIH